MKLDQLNNFHFVSTPLLRKFCVLFFALAIFTGPSLAQSNMVDSIFYDGVWRNYRLHLPAGFDPQSELPLVVNMHGLGSNALEQEIYTGMDFVADTANFAICYPNGLNNSWNILGDTIDDIGFIDSLIDHLHVNYNFNLQRVYATGMSNGGFMTHLLACQLTYRFAAVADVTGGNTVPNQAFCSPSKKIPVLHIHGTDDPLVPYNGNFGIVSVDNLMTYWATHNGCDLITDTIKIPNINTSDQSTAERIDWLNCDGNTEVILYRVINGEHTWPGSPILIGITNQDFEASEVIWQFFNQSLAKPTGRAKIDQSDPVSIYPNPVGTHLNITGTGQITSGILFDLNGKAAQIIPQKTVPATLVIQDVPPGIYMLQLNMDGAIIQRQIVKR